MAKQSASAYIVREGENKPRLAAHREIETRSLETQGDVAQNTKSPSRIAQQRLEAHHARNNGATLLWEVRCPELGMPAWTRRIGSAEHWRMAREMAEALDHDAARVMGFGGKKFILQMRHFGKSHITQMEISGGPVWRYHAKMVD